eukprot:m.94376 g.94376  ORF g.94376 m.94376 type:complete len:212 (+) comp36812_c0_seq44:138-773(+)
MARKLDADTRKRRGFRRSFAGRRMQDVCRRPQLGDYRMYDVIFLSESFLREFFVANLKKHFSQFGEVLECNIKMDNTTKKSRGFGFVLYSSPDHVRKVLEQSEPHIIDGKKVDAKRAVPHLTKGPVNPRAKKVFVGALHESIDEEMLKEHFEQYGKVGDIDFPTDKTSNKRRGFCFVALESEEQVALATQKRFQEIKGYTVGSSPSEFAFL